MPRDIRPFRDAQEFMPHSSRLLRNRETGDFCRVTQFNDHWVKIDGVAIPYQTLAEQYVFAESRMAVGLNRGLATSLGGE